MQHNVVLRSLTLRGVGPYLHGTRLEIRPLTLLCGKNGSGKSTWFKMLNMLERSYNKDLLPFVFDDPVSYDYDYTNAFISLAETEHTRLFSGEDDKQYGPLGTIGLEFEIADDLELSKERDDLDFAVDPGSPAQSFLWYGRCPRGSRFRLRLAHPSNHWSENPGLFEPLALEHLVELRFNDTFVIRFRRGPDQARYTLECSRAFRPGRGDEVETDVFVEVEANESGEFEAHPLEGSSLFDLQRTLCEKSVQRIRELLHLLLSSYFYLSGIREIHDYRDFRCLHETKHRYVGAKGEATLALERAYAYNLMRQAQPPFIGSLSQRFEDGEVEHGLRPEIERARRSQGPPTQQRVWDLASPQTKQELVKSIEDLGQLYHSSDYNPLDPDSKWKESRALWEVSARIADLFNEVLENRDLYQPAIWPTLEEEAQYLVQQGVENLSLSDLHRLNRLLIEAAFYDEKKASLKRRPSLLFETYVSVWLKRLVNVRITLSKLGPLALESLGDAWTCREKLGDLPSGFLVHSRPHPEPPFKRVSENASSNDDAPQSVDRFHHLCFGPGKDFMRVLPGHLSAGFHQVAPMVVQAGLMLQNELFCIENPEVHLHPSLQLDVTEFLMRQAFAGIESKKYKLIVIETHSDLVVRRILRAILQEDLPQEAVRLYFTDLQEGPEKYYFSKLEPITVNGQGQISNWPEGFMDDDVLESRRLLDVMYGASSGEYEGDEQP